jgi:hypothetical protein
MVRQQGAGTGGGEGDGEEANDKEAYSGGAHGLNREGPMGKKHEAEKRLLAGKSVGKESDSDKRGGKRARRLRRHTRSTSSRC